MKRKSLTAILFAVALAPVCLEGFMKKTISGSVWSVVLALSFTSLGFPAQVFAAVHALFELSTPATGPFPTRHPGAPGLAGVVGRGTGRPSTSQDPARSLSR
jgi:hypothetical protein